MLYRLAEPGGALGAGGNVVTLLDITDAYMTIFLPTSQAAPTTHFVSMAQAILYRGAGFEVVWASFVSVFAITMVFFTL